ncbi:unnamed protein product [Rotaria socialis]|nr:unnamed protein product [Rotaria socialis]CAF3383412.1 unnamed protein product [Rotaria socialis]CAF4211745.1 unnamed protein product [Rotaria socialis]CAF4506796.1 unnamed protein product [Rotaria socialis]
MFSFVFFALVLVGTGSTTNCLNRQAIEQSLNKGHIPGAVIVVVNATNILYDISGHPAGLLRMSAISLSMFLRMFINNGYTLLSSQSIAEMKQAVGGGLIRPYNDDARINSTDLLPSRRYELAWHWRTLSNTRQYLGHGDSLPGMII